MRPSRSLVARAAGLALFTLLLPILSAAETPAQRLTFYEVMIPFLHTKELVKAASRWS